MMMQRFFLLIAMCLFTVGFGQKKFKDHQFPAKYVLKTSSDTVRSHIQNLGAFKASTYSPATIIRKLYMIDDSGKKFSLNETEVSYIEFVDTKNTKHVFTAAPENMRLGLVEPLHNGRINYFVDYFFTNLYGNFSFTEYLVEEGKETIKSGLFSSSGKMLKERFAAYPDHLTLVDTMKTREDLVNILKLYDQK